MKRTNAKEKDNRYVWGILLLLFCLVFLGVSQLSQHLLGEEPAPNAFDGDLPPLPNWSLDSDAASTVPSAASASVVPISEPETRLLRSSEETQPVVTKNDVAPVTPTASTVSTDSNTAPMPTISLFDQNQFSVGPQPGQLVLPGPADVELVSEKEVQAQNAESFSVNPKPQSPVVSDKGQVMDNGQIDLPPFPKMEMQVSRPVASESQLPGVNVPKMENTGMPQTRDVLVYDSTAYFGVRVVDRPVEEVPAEKIAKNAIEKQSIAQPAMEPAMVPAMEQTAEPVSDLGSIAAAYLHGTDTSETGMTELSDVRKATVPPRPGAFDFDPDLARDENFNAEEEIGFAHSQSDDDETFNEMDERIAQDAEELLANHNELEEEASMAAESSTASGTPIAAASTAAGEFSNDVMNELAANLHPESPKVAQETTPASTTESLVTPVAEAMVVPVEPVADSETKKSFWGSFEFPWSHKDVTTIQHSPKENSVASHEVNSKKAKSPVAAKEKKSMTSSISSLFAIKSSKSTDPGHSSKSMKAATPKGAKRTKATSLTTSTLKEDTPKATKSAKSTSGTNGTSFWSSLNPFAKN